MSNIIVLDLEAARSAVDCKHCNRPKIEHGLENDHLCVHYDPIGWSNKPALGLSIGGYYSYADDRVHWFDEHNLLLTIARLVDEQPLMVSFNGIAFDFPLMRGILRRRADNCSDEPDYNLHALCDRFKTLAAKSYDILAEVWKAAPADKMKRGLNSLDAISRANGVGGKLSHGYQAPRDWASGRRADVINYCQDDILKTRALFDIIREQEGILSREDGSKVLVRFITGYGAWCGE
jgi:hypothetical protein